MSAIDEWVAVCYNDPIMIDEENVLKTARAVVRQYNLPLKITAVEEGGEEVKIFYTTEKRTPLRELAQELELQLNLPIKLERLKKSETGKIGGIDVLGNYPCCAPFLRQCPFAGKDGCGYGFRESMTQRVKASKADEKPADAKAAKPPQPPKTQKKAKSKRKKMVRRIVIKG